MSATTTPPVIQGDVTGGLIPYKNPTALIAYYCGIFSLIPLLGLFAGIPAVILGIIGLRKHKANPVVKGVAHAWIGIGLGGFTTVLWLGLIVLMIMAATA